MIQEILVILIVAAAALVAGYWVYRFFTKAEAGCGCNPSKCSSCPSANDSGECEPPDFSENRNS
ncbi:MAG: FeoB-associated Cys-rich membrane protein [bacterium]|nr:FeoB-associated Cys-rich membrane protein [bacterium]